MRLIALQKMFGIDSLEIRKFMREATGSKWRLGFLAATFGRNSARKVVRAMLTDDLIAKAGRRYELTARGRALGMARAAQPLKRATADRLVWHFLRRVEEVNCDPNLLFWIDAVVVFGSYATTTLSVMSEIDLAVLYSKRVGPDLWTELADRRVDTARDSGRKFRSVSEKTRWPLKEIELKLRKHHWTLHLHDFGKEKEFIESVPHHLIFLRRGIVPTWNLENRLIAHPGFNRWCRRVLELTEGRAGLSEQSLVER